MEPPDKPTAPPQLYPQPEMPPMRYPPSKKPPGGTLKKVLAPLMIILVIGATWIGKLKLVIPAVIKFLPVLLKTGVTMILTVGSFMVFYSWRFAVGFVLLILLHEFGHVIAARMLGLKVSAPVFVPFLGAFVLLNRAPKDAWIEALVGIGGPLLGSAASFVCIGVYVATGQTFWYALGWTGLMINLLNLMPMAFLDGARVLTAISPRLCAIGFAGLAATMIFVVNIMLLPILIFVFPRLLPLFRKRPEDETRYREVTPGESAFVALLYFGLAAALALGMGHQRFWPSPQ